MAHGLWWSFGEPREANDRLVTDFYYQTGRHAELHLPWPSKPFTAAGDLAVRINNGSRLSDWPTDLTIKSVETGRLLYELLGKEAQASLIRAFANLSENRTERILRLHFPTPTPENRELCLALEDLPWELLHDGEEFITWRYSIQIIRAHTRDVFPSPNPVVDVNSWGILLVSPFVFASDEECLRVGLEPLPQGMEEIKTLRELQNQTHGLIRVVPHRHKRLPSGITTFSELEHTLLNGESPHVQLIHFIGHGVIYDDEPCLCFESSGGGGIDYVSVKRLQKLFIAIQENKLHQEIPSILFLNACSSSSRGRYSAGFASGLHDLGLCVMGYHAEIYDDGKPSLAARSFYQSMCVEQSLHHPDQRPNVVTAVGAARRRLRDVENESNPVWGSLRAYLPHEVSFSVHGRGMVERSIQALYSHFSHWMNPGDYTDHLSIGFQFAIFFGAVMGLINLAFIFPETVLARHFTYQEIVSEITRIFLVGPLSFLAGAIFIALQTRRNYQFLYRHSGKIPLFHVIGHCITSLPVYLISGLAFAFLFFYSFSRLDLLTAQTTAFASLTETTVSYFWYGFVGLLGGTVALSLLFSSGFCLRKKETLHSYRSYYFILGIFILIGLSYVIYTFYGIDVNQYRVMGWVVYVLLSIIVYTLAVTKLLKEISWRASQKSMPSSALSWKKLVPLLGSVMLVVLCYFLLEESVRFEEHTIQRAMIEQKESIGQEEKDPYVTKVLERALRQRAIREIPDSIERVAEEDWLLSVVYADYLLYQAESLTQHVIEKCQTYLDNSIVRNPEVQFKDYFCNIQAMVIYNKADMLTDQDKKRKLYQEAKEFAKIAVEKDNSNFAYLDTLARAEWRLAKYNPSILDDAASNIREAQWRAFFLRSPRAGEVKRSIDNMAEKILNARSS